MGSNLLRASALTAFTLLGIASAAAFTFENPGQNPGSTTSPNAAAGYAGMDPASVLPPVSESIPGLRFDHGPSSYNNGFASPPDPSSSIGPSWLYGRR